MKSVRHQPDGIPGRARSFVAGLATVLELDPGPARALGDPVTAAA